MSSTTATATAPPDTAPTPAPGTGHEGQTFLVGDEIYIRAVEEADAKRGTTWRNSPFPWSSDRMETWIKEEMPKDKRASTYLIVRKSDDLPVGSLRTGRWDSLTTIEPYVDPLLAERGRRWLAEALRLVLPWLVDEQHRPLAIVELTSEDGPAIAAVEGIGGRQVVRFREQIFRDGRHVDGLVFEYLNAQWVGTLGDPNATEPERTGTGEPRPVPARVTLDGDPPANAMLVGQRVYLRPIEPKDAEVAARASRQETETFWDNGRFMRSQIGFATWNETLQKEDPQESVRFAICLRETDAFIGSLGIADVQYLHRYGESESEIALPEHRGKGYGSEAKHLLFEYAFDHLKLHALQSFVIFPNTRSAAALRKQGYREAGRINWAYPMKGGFGNALAFDLLASDWRAMPRTDGIAAPLSKERRS